MEKIGVVGAGWVGKSMIEMFPEAEVYDKHLNVGSQALINECEVTFIAVPTPNTNLHPEGFSPRLEGPLDSSIVEEVVNWCESELLVIRSTVMPGTADRLKEQTGKRIVSQPEYLGETTAHPMLDQGERPFMILGGSPADRRKVIETYQGVYNANINIRQVSNLEAEVIKLSENRAIAYKVAQCQELYDACEASGVDYYTIRDAVYGDDPRFDLWFSFIYPQARGMDSKCIPKDVYAWAAWSESLGVTPQITNAILEKNKEWIGA